MIRAAAEDAAEAAAEAAEAATAAANVASGLAVAALVVSIVAAAFAGWQAVTAHLTRSDSLKARWEFEVRGHTAQRSRAESGWFLHNVGGSAATDVRLVAEYMGEFAKSEKHFETQAKKPVAKDAWVQLAGTEGRGAASQWWVPGKDPGGWAAAALDKKHRPVDARAVRRYRQWATVHWTDDKSRERSAKVPLY